MYNLQGLIDHIATTGYSTSWARAKEVDMGNAGDPVKVYVGYFSVESNGQLGDGDTPDQYYEGEEDLSQLVIVQFVTDTPSLHTVWKTLYDKNRMWVPSPNEQNYTGFMYSSGGVMGLQGGRTWWLDRWRIDFPRVSSF